MFAMFCVVVFCCGMVLWRVVMPRFELVCCFDVLDCDVLIRVVSLCVDMSMRRVVLYCVVLLCDCL